MAEKKLKIGDVVILKSGSPKMTVMHYESNGSVKCTWFYDGTSTFNVNTFWEESLAKVEEHSGQ